MELLTAQNMDFLILEILFSFLISLEWKVVSK